MKEKNYLVDVSGYRPGRSVVKKEEIKLRPSPIYKGMYVGQIIGPETGCFCSTHSLDLYHIPPGVSTGVYRHDDTILHVLSGKGYSIIDDVKYEWERGDTIHIKPGVWYQHSNPSQEPANMLAVKATQMINLIKPFGPTIVVGKGDYVELEEIEYEHPFGLGKQKPKGAPGKPDSLDEWRKRTRDALANEIKNARVILKGKEVQWEYGGHRGELNAMLAYPGLGFDSRMPFHIGLQAMVPGGSNETHQHMEAIVYILSGKGSVVVNGASTEVKEGDCCFVHWGEHHQFRASKDSPKLFIQMRIHVKEFQDWAFPFIWFEEKEGIPTAELDPNYVPKLPW